MKNNVLFYVQVMCKQTVTKQIFITVEQFVKYCKF